MLRRNYIEPDKITLVRWVDLALDLDLQEKNHVRVQSHRDLAT
jgi:hypothetical protein